MPASPRFSRAPRFLVGVLAICSLGALVYSNSLDAAFVYDDTRSITGNPRIRVEHLGWRELYEAAFESPLPRPVANLSFALNHYIGEYEVAGYHVVNVAIHLVNGVLVYLLALFLFAHSAHPRPSREWAALLAALVFTAHPVQSQSVTYVVQRMSSLAVMFYLGALLLYLRGRSSPRGWRRWASWAGAGAAWILALGSKETAAVLPVTIWLCEWYFFQDLSRAWLRRSLKFGCVVLALLATLTFFYLGEHPIERLLNGYTRRDFSLTERVWTEFRVVVFYISLLLFPLPSRLNLLHEFPLSRSLWDPITTPLSVLSLLALAALAVYTARKRPLVSFCLLWFFLHLVIESSVIPLELIYEHRLYLPMLGFAVLVADLLSSGFAARRPWAWVAGALLVAALGTAAHARNEVWRDGVTLWSDVLAKNPGSHRAHYNLANELEARGRRGEAIRHYEEALRIRPRAAYIHVNLGIAIKRSGRPEGAIRHYQAALGLEPDSAPAHNNLGVALDKLERLEEAVSHYSEALRIDPEYAKAHNNLAATLLRQGRTDEAIHHFSEALRIDPDYASARRNLGLVLGRSSAPTESDSRAQR